MFFSLFEFIKQGNSSSSDFKSSFFKHKFQSDLVQLEENLTFARIVNDNIESLTDIKILLKRSINFL